MKVRTGFVSNSSSSSFCLIGIVFNEDDFSKKIKDVYDYFHGTGLELVRGFDNYYDRYVVGIDPRNMKNEETLGQFKQKIFEKLKELGFKNDISKVDFRIDGGYDG